MKLIKDVNFQYGRANFGEFPNVKFLADDTPAITQYRAHITTFPSIL